MDKSCHSSGGGDSTVPSAAATTTTTTTTSSNSSGSSSGNRETYLKYLNKISHKISKPNRKPPVYESQNIHNQLQHQNHHIPPPPPQQLPQQSRAAAEAAEAMNLQPQAPPQQQQPPVYNINKSDFRDVVQRLTGSPAHERISTPPPIQPPKPPSSRLQRFRPPPLAQISNRPPPLTVGGGGGGVPPAFYGGQRPVQAQPLSPLPPFPAVHAAAESPISAYMRFLQNSISSNNPNDSDPKRFSSGLSPLAPLASPRWNSLAPPQNQPPFMPSPPLPPPQQNQNIPPPPPSVFSSVFSPYPAYPLSPLPFGCLPSPRSPYGLLSPSRQLGFQQLPLSPTLPVPSPTWKGI